MPTKSASVRDLSAKIDEVKQKLILLEGDRKAHSESGESSLQENREKINSLREENKTIRKKLSEKNKTGGTEKMILIGEDTNGDLKNKLNLLKYETKKREKILKDLRKQNGSSVSREDNDVKEKQAARDLENRLDKTNLKQKEAEHIQRTYQQIKARLEDEHKTYSTQLDQLQQEINRMKIQMKELQSMNTEATGSRDAARSELERREKQVFAERRRMELEMQKVKKEAEEKRMLQSQLNIKRQDASHLMGDELTEEQRERLREEEEEEKIRNYETFFRVIKDATGVSDTQEVVVRFEMQGETKEQLNDLKNENEQTISELTEKKDAVTKKYDELLYTGDNTNEKQAEVFEQNDDLAKEKQRKVETEQQLKKSAGVLIDAKSGIDHLAEKLLPVKLDEEDKHTTKESDEVKSQDEQDKDIENKKNDPLDDKDSKKDVEEVDSDKVAEKNDETAADEVVVLRKLDECEKKLQKLSQHAEKQLSQDGKNIKQVSKEMEELEFQLASEIQLPMHNTRIIINDDARDAIFADEDLSGEDEEILTREKLKKQSQALVESKNKRLIGKRKKKTK